MASISAEEIGGIERRMKAQSLRTATINGVKLQYELRGTGILRRKGAGGGPS